MLQDKKWDVAYTSDEGDLSERFYVPALTDAVRYCRGTGYFTADSLVRNIRGLEGLIRNKGKMRLLVGCTLDRQEVDAIRRGEDWRRQVEKNLINVPLDMPDTHVGLELLSWMIAQGYMDIRISVMCDKHGDPIAGPIYHQKKGIVQDAAGDRIAWSGSDNETARAQTSNSESFDVYTSWELPDRVQRKEQDFELDWEGRPGRTLVMDVPQAVRRKLLSFAPSQGQQPALIRRRDEHLQDTIWEFIGQAHTVKNGEMVGLGTAPVIPWPHQVQVVRRLQARKPARFLIADEVGLGKTIQAGLFLRQAWLEGKERILVMVPASLAKQWQIELREKLNLDWPIYDGSNLIWQATHAGRHQKEEPVDGPVGHGPIIMSSHLARRDERYRDIADAGWDVVILDEAHHARRKSPNPKQNTPGKLLRLMRALKHKTANLILLTATPMQIHPVELYDLLDLLGMPDIWDWPNFEKFANCLSDHDLSDRTFLCKMFVASERLYGDINKSKLANDMKGRKVLRVLRGGNERLHDAEYDTMGQALRLGSPISQLVSRNTRKQLRQYIRDSGLDWRLGTRQVSDDFYDMSRGERNLYDAVFEYTRRIWNSYSGKSRRATGFLSSTYLVRMTSSLNALKATLQNHLDYMQGKTDLEMPEFDDMDDMDDMIPDALKEMMIAMRRDKSEIYRLLDMVENLPRDTKFDRLVYNIRSLPDEYQQVMVFTQFTDTMDFLRENLSRRWPVMCYSGRGGEIVGSDNKWVRLSRKETKEQFAQGAAKVLLCTQAAAEGLNFQFCGALINYDMPWNPMKVEQRIGRIDRIGQKHDTIRIVNLYYNDTVEEKRYRVLRKRYNLFEETVGRLPSILSDADVIEKIHEDADISGESLLDVSRNDRCPDLDAILAADTTDYEPPQSPVTMSDLDRVAADRYAMRKFAVRYAGSKLYEIKVDGVPYRITADRAQFERYADSLEFWSPGSPLFPKPKSGDIPTHATLKEILDESGVP